MEKKNFYFTVDFEDFAFNFLRENSGITTFRGEALNEAMRECISLSELLGNVFTIFLSGNLLEAFPDIAKTLHQNGFEIASHYFHHDDFNKETLEEAEKNIEKIMDLSLTSYGNIPVGFRAPRFSLRKSDFYHIELIKKYFKYDSSIVLDVTDKKDMINSNEEFRFFPIFQKKSFLGPISTGGLYARLNPTYRTLKLLDQIHISNQMPIIYFHPYEFICGTDFKLVFSEINNCKKLKKIRHQFFHSVRQNILIAPGSGRFVYNLMGTIQSKGWKAKGNLMNKLITK